MSWVWVPDTSLGWQLAYAMQYPDNCVSKSDVIIIYNYYGSHKSWSSLIFQVYFWRYDPPSYTSYLLGLAVGEWMSSFGQVLPM